MSKKTTIKDPAMLLRCLKRLGEEGRVRLGKIEVVRSLGEVRELAGQKPAVREGLRVGGVPVEIRLTLDDGQVGFRRSEGIYEYVDGRRSEAARGEEVVQGLHAMQEIILQEYALERATAELRAMGYALRARQVSVGNVVRLEFVKG